jgi:hypothetical protein
MARGRVTLQGEERSVDLRPAHALQLFGELIAPAPLFVQALGGPQPLAVEGLAGLPELRREDGGGHEHRRRRRDARVVQSFPQTVRPKLQEAGGDQSGQQEDDQGHSGRGRAEAREEAPADGGVPGSFAGVRGSLHPVSVHVRRAPVVSYLQLPPFFSRRTTSRIWSASSSSGASSV